MEQFQVVYVSYPKLNQNKMFKDQVEIIMSSTFDKNNASNKKYWRDIAHVFLHFSCFMKT